MSTIETFCIFSGQLVTVTYSDGTDIVCPLYMLGDGSYDLRPSTGVTLEKITAQDGIFVATATGGWEPIPLHTYQTLLAAKQKPLDNMPACDNVATPSPTSGQEESTQSGATGTTSE